MPDADPVHTIRLVHSRESRQDAPAAAQPVRRRWPDVGTELVHELARELGRMEARRNLAEESD